MIKVETPERITSGDERGRYVFVRGSRTTLRAIWS